MCFRRDHCALSPHFDESMKRGLSIWIWSEALIIYSIHEYNRCIYEYLYIFIKFKEITVTLPVL